MDSYREKLLQQTFTSTRSADKICRFGDRISHEMGILGNLRFFDVLHKCSEGSYKLRRNIPVELYVTRACAQQFIIDSFIEHVLSRLHMSGFFWDKDLYVDNFYGHL